MKNYAQLFLDQARIVHGDKYDYSKVIYVKASAKVVITCPVHGDFEQRPNNHISFKQGCKLCHDDIKRSSLNPRRLSTAEFIERAKALYGDTQYTYEHTLYVSSSKPVVITRITHGDFSIARAEKHLYGQGCPHCTQFTSQGERIIADALRDVGVEFLHEYRFFDCVSPASGRKLAYDFFIPSMNTLIEFDGEQHSLHSPLMNKRMTLEKYAIHDAVKNNYAFSHGITLHRFSYTHITTLRDEVMRCLNVNLHI